MSPKKPWDACLVSHQAVRRVEKSLFCLGPSWDHLSLSQVGNHIDVLTGKWVAQDAGIGAGVDSYFEYLVKGAILLQDKKLMAMFLGKKGRIKGLSL